MNILSTVLLVVGIAAVVVATKTRATTTKATTTRRTTTRATRTRATTTRATTTMATTTAGSPTDCVYKWEDWYPCSYYAPAGDCGSFLKIRRRLTIQEASNGGVPCETGLFLQYVTCERSPVCPGDKGTLRADFGAVLTGLTHVTAKNYGNTTQITAENREDCGSACLANDQCNAYLWDLAEITKQCTIFTPLDQTNGIPLHIDPFVDLPASERPLFFLYIRYETSTTTEVTTATTTTATTTATTTTATTTATTTMATTTATTPAGSPTDCVYRWGEYTPCSVRTFTKDCGSMLNTRFGYPVQEATNGGVPCETPFTFQIAACKRSQCPEDEGKWWAYFGGAPTGITHVTAKNYGNTTQITAESDEDCSNACRAMDQCKACLWDALGRSKQCTIFTSSVDQTNGIPPDYRGTQFILYFRYETL